MIDNALRRLRKEAGYKTAEEFANHIGIPVQTYSRWERGDNNKEILMYKAWIIADALDCTIDEIVGRIEPNRSTGYKGLSDKSRKDLEDYIEFLTMRDMMGW